MNDRTRTAVARQAERELTDTRWDPLRTPTARRALVVAFAASLAVTTAVFVAAGGWGLVALAAPIAAVYLLRRSVRTVADLPDEHLDERLVAERDRTYVHAYRVLAAVTVVTVLTLQLVAERATLGFHDVGAAFWLLTLGAVGLPSAVLAWTHPDER